MIELVVNVGYASGMLLSWVCTLRSKCVRGIVTLTFCFGIPFECVQVEYTARIHQSGNCCKEAHIFFLFQVVEHTLNERVIIPVIVANCLVQRTIWLSMLPPRNIEIPSCSVVITISDGMPFEADMCSSTISETPRLFRRFWA